MKIDCPECFGGRKPDVSVPGVEDDWDDNIDKMPSGDLAARATMRRHPAAVVVCRRCGGSGKIERVAI